MAGLLIDTDAFILLAGGDVLDRAVALIGLPPEDTFRLDPLPYMIGRNRGIRERYPAETRDRARAAANRYPGIGRRPSDDVLQRLVEIPDIDDGEALLFGITAEEPGYLMASGDKRAIVALCTRPELADIREAVAGRVICIESILRRIVLEDGIERTSMAFQALTPAHKTLQVLFSPACSRSVEAFLQGADSYIADLRSAVGEGFLRAV